MKKLGSKGEDDAKREKYNTIQVEKMENEKTVNKKKY